MKCKYQHIIIMFFVLGSLSAQQVVDHAKLAVQNATLDPYTARYDVAGDDHYLYFSNGKNQVATFNESVFEGNYSDVIEEYKRRDFHMLQFDEDFNVQNNLVIDNVEENFHVMTHTEDAHVLLFHFDNEINNDPLAAMKMLPNIEIPRANHLGASMLLIADLDLNYLKHVFPTTGKITQIKGEGASIYMNINMAADQDFILLNADTVHNFRAQFGRENHTVLAKYNLSSETFDWWYRPFGNFINMYSNGLEIDNQGNCYQLLMTDANIYLPNGDTARYGEYHAPVLLKFDPDGNIIWHIDFDESEVPLFGHLSLDDENNAYISGSYSGPRLTLSDTVLVYDVLDGYPMNGVGAMIKINEQGDFQWAKQLKGPAYLSSLLGVVNDEHGNIYAHGHFTRGSVTMNGVAYDDIDERRNNNEFILKMDAHTGADLSHVMMQGDVRIRNLGYTSDKLFAQYELRDEVEIFGESFSTTGDREVFIVAIDELFSGIFQSKQTNVDLVNVYPNPVLKGEDVVISAVYGALNEAKYMLIDAQGLIVDAGQWSAGNDFNNISTKHQNAGVYSLLVQSKNNYETIKLLINQ